MDILTAPLVPKSAAALMPDNTDSFSDALLELLNNCFRAMHPDLSEAVRVCICIFSVVLLISTVQLLTGASSKTLDLVGAVTIAGLLLGSSDSMIRMSEEAIREISDYAKLLLPVMTSAMAAQGGVTASTALYAGTAAFNSILTALLTKLLIPAIYMYLALSVSNAAMGENSLKKLADLIKSLSQWILKTILYIFTGYISITGVVSGTTDAAALKAAKLTISGAVPVVGGILSDASEAVLVGAGMVRNAAGIYGILAVLAIAAEPFLKLSGHYLLIRLTATVCEVFGVKSCTNLIADFAAAMGLMLAMTGSVCLLQLISTVCFLRGVG